MMPMKRREFVRKATLGAAGTGVLASCGGSEPQAGAGTNVVTGPRVSWRLASSYPPSLDILTGVTESIAARVEALTGGQFTIRVFAANELVPALQVMDGVQSGTVQAGYTADYYYIGKNPALAFGTAIPFGLTYRQRAAWMSQGGGLELLRDIYSDFGIVTFVCGSTGPQFGGWFREPVESLADMRGLRMRIPGLAGEIMARLGVSVQVLAAPEIYPALERGAIDATEWVGPYDDEKLGLHEIAKNYYIPGWWEPGVTMTLMVGLDAWNDLPPTYQEALRSACDGANVRTVARYDVENPPALARLTSEHGVTLRSFSDEIMEASWRESTAYLKEQAAADADFRRLYESFREFRARSFEYFHGNDFEYARFAFPKV